jgi:hypothetical protein
MNSDPDNREQPTDEVVQGSRKSNLSALVIPLLRGVIYRDEVTSRTAGRWIDLLKLQAQVRDYVAVLGLELIVDESEGHAFLRSKDPDADDSADKLPRLVARRPLTFPISLLLALLRKKLAEFDAGGSDEVVGTRLVLTRDDIVELMRVFLADSSNEARLMDRVDSYINKVVELRYLRKMKSAPGQPVSYEVRRILKSFVDAQWLAEFDTRLLAYQTSLQTNGDDDSTGDSIE